MILDDKTAQDRLKNDIGKRITQLRTDRNLTQAKVGELIGCSEKHVNEVERGKSMFNVYKMMDFCELVDCNMEYLLRGCSPLDRSFEIISQEITRIVISGNRQERERLKEYMENFRDVISSSGSKRSKK